MSDQGIGQSVLVQGRLVWTLGNLFEGKLKTDDNNNPVLDNRTGTQVREYGFGLAIPKVDPATGQHTQEYLKIWDALHKEAFTLFPNGHIPDNFSMKFKDGDGYDHNGKPFADREGYAGHIILACTTRIPIKFFRFEGGNNIMINDGIKCGDYVQVQTSIKAHPAKGQGKAGLYVNPHAVQLVTAGKEIVNAPSGDQIFGQAAPVYSGQVVADTAPQMPNMVPAATGATPQGMPPQQPQQAPAPAAPAMPQQQPAQAQPHYGVIPQTAQPQAPQAPAMPQQGNVPPTATPAPQTGQMPQQHPPAQAAPNAYPSNGAPTPPMPQ